MMCHTCVRSAAAGVNFNLACNSRTVLDSSAFLNSTHVQVTTDKSTAKIVQLQSTIIQHSLLLQSLVLAWAAGFKAANAFYQKSGGRSSLEKSRVYCSAVMMVHVVGRQQGRPPFIPLFHWSLEVFFWNTREPGRLHGKTGDT